MGSIWNENAGFKGFFFPHQVTSLIAEQTGFTLFQKVLWGFPKPSWHIWEISNGGESKWLDHSKKEKKKHNPKITALHQSILPGIFQKLVTAKIRLWGFLHFQMWHNSLWSLTSVYRGRSFIFLTIWKLPQCQHDEKMSVVWLSSAELCYII